jgi:hypothetical protein
MKLLAWLLASTSVLQAAAGKPPHAEQAATARWQMNQAQWGVLATTSVHLNGIAFGNPVSVEDGLGDGTPYFYVSMLDASMQDIAKDPQCTLTLSEASIDCQTLQLDPEDPRCIRLSLSGPMVNVTGDEASKAKAALFKKHPEMKSWPADHNWLITKIQIEKIWLIDYFGGAADISVEDYKKATPPADATPINASYTPSHSKPVFLEKVHTARWLAHESRWGSLATTSIHLNGAAFGNTISMSDGTSSKSTGIPYFYVSNLDTSMQDLKRNPNGTLTLSEASVDCTKLKLDPEDPRCVRLSLTGSMVNVTDADELTFAKNALFTSHPVMKEWPADHDFHVVKMDISRIWMIDFFGGASDISPKDYFAIKHVNNIQFV